MRIDKFILTLAVGLAALMAGAAPLRASEAEPSAAPQAGTVVQVHGVVLDTDGQPVVGAAVMETAS